jgi:Fic family protein
MMTDLYRGFADPLSDETMFAWHAMLVNAHRDIRVIGGYRAHADPMRIISGTIHDPMVHFEAPPSSRMKNEMDTFVSWFNDTAPNCKRPLAALTRSGIAHLYFVSIHPFEDGNGRIGRALAEKSAGAKSQPAKPYRIGLHGRARAQGVLRGAGAQQQGNRNNRLADLFRRHRTSGTTKHDPAR